MLLHIAFNKTLQVTSYPLPATRYPLTINFFEHALSQFTTLNIHNSEYYLTSGSGKFKKKLNR